MSMIELNLLPDVKLEFVKAQRQKRLVIAAMILTVAFSVGLVAVLGIYAYAAQPVRQKFADDAINSKTKDLQKSKNIVRNLTIQNQLVAVNEIHAIKPVYERIFDYLKVVNPEAPNNVSVSKIAITQDENGNSILLIEASAADYQAVSVFNDTLKNALLSYRIDGETKKNEKLFNTVTVSDMGVGKNSSGKQVTSFKVSLEYNENAFSWLADKIKVTVPNKKTNQSADNVKVFADAPVTEETQ